MASDRGRAAHRGGRTAGLGASAQRGDLVRRGAADRSRGQFHALYPVEGLALVAAESGDMQRALRLYEASVRARRRLDTEPGAPGRRRMEQAAARARTRLSAAAQDAAVAVRGLRGERLVAYALGAGSGEDRTRRDVRARPTSGSGSP